MFEFHGIIHLLASLLVAIHHVSGNFKVPTPKKPKVFCSGWPNVSAVTVSMETIPVDGIIQYDLFYNRTCPFVSETECSSAVTDLSLIDGCRRVENQTLASLRTLAGKDLSCTVCNSTKNCYLMGITKDHDLCLYLRVNTSYGYGTSHVCLEKNIIWTIRFSPPKAIQLLATTKKQLTVLWERPEEIKPSALRINYKVVLQDRFGKCNVKERYGNVNGNVNSFTFTNLSPWSNYSVTVCGGFHMAYIQENITTCTCGDDYHLPGGPVFNRTLPEEPSEHPLLQPCESLCDDTNFSAILKWKASNNLIWNGIPTKSLIRIWSLTSPVAHQEEDKLGAPTATFSVPLESNYNGSLVMRTINLTRNLTYIAKVQFCSNGGCGPEVRMTMSCDVCESLETPGTLSENHSKNEDQSHWPEIGAGVAFFVLVVAVIVTITVNKKKRRRNHLSLQDRIGHLPPAIYEEAYSPDLTSDEGPYSDVYSSESQLLCNDGQREQWV